MEIRSKLANQRKKEKDNPSMKCRIYVHLSDTNTPLKKRLHNTSETNKNVVGIM